MSETLKYKKFYLHFFKFYTYNSEKMLNSPLFAVVFYVLYYINTRYWASVCLISSSVYSATKKTHIFLNFTTIKLHRRIGKTTCCYGWSEISKIKKKLTWFSHIGLCSSLYQQKKRCYNIIETMILNMCIFK